MPDWSYHPLIRPALFRLPPERARDLTLDMTGKLAALPFGGALIDLMGHMRPPDSLHVAALGLSFASPVGLGAGLDTQGVASVGFSGFGFGFLEVGPVTVHPVRTMSTIQRYPEEAYMRVPDLPVNEGLESLKTQLQKNGNLSIPIGIRIGYSPGSHHINAAQERVQLMRELDEFADFFVLECQFELVDGLWNMAMWAEHLELIQSLKPTQRPILIALKPDLPLLRAREIVEIALARGISGVVVSGGVKAPDEMRTIGVPARNQSLDMVRALHSEYRDRLTIIASGGIQQPQDVLDFLDAGAKLVQIFTGFVYSGPGLPKRINEALAHRGEAIIESPPFYTTSWFWALLLGFGLFISGLVVWFVAITRTVLPYDESFVGISREALMNINPRLLAFMAHDRVTVAGTMIATGIVYIGLAWGGMRRGSRWAKHVFVASAALGFVGFFLFLGFGYFDPLHAVLSFGLLPFLLLSIFGKVTVEAPMPAPNLNNNSRWHSGQWGQLMFVVIGGGLLLSGFAITTVGITSVFVPQDLGFMQTSAEVLGAANSRLIPLIAHDRAGFGGNLISIGVGVLLLSLWGFRQGERWVWWTLSLGGSIGFIAGVGIHLSVGYLDLFHLFPALAALVIFVVGLIFCFPYLYYPENRLSARSRPTTLRRDNPIP